MPDTRISLILRLPQSADAAAWREFVELYEPLVLRFARKRGLQEADAQDLVQRVFASVAGAVDRWQPDAARGRLQDSTQQERPSAKLMWHLSVLECKKRDSGSCRKTWRG